MLLLRTLTLEFASPCPASWDEMEGDERVRSCGECDQNVYNFSEMTEDEALALLREREGRVCVRVYQRDDGTSLTKDCPVGAAKGGVEYLGRPTTPDGWIAFRPSGASIRQIPNKAEDQPVLRVQHYREVEVELVGA